MGWSTSQLAKLAGTSLRTVRHYHEIGLLPQPRRRPNGYKDYGVEHLIRLLRIRRLTELGLSLPQIAELGSADEHPVEALRALDAELAAGIERLRRARVELALILRQSAPTDLPPELASAVAGLSPADRAMMVVAAQVLGPEALDAYVASVRRDRLEPTAAEFDRLPADADEPTRQDLAERMSDYARGVYAESPMLLNLTADAPLGKRFAQEALGKAVVELYNPAQIDVLVRMVGRL
ncbi:MerR family transcriptional regulator [Amycolatopsis suaedae]|uniref:MerR family transcriptional regulator n=2 Tax=Amycolatopsis suaedae TaxID=2510978 RepID=A0A4Q7J9S9_9PSEU|nr:MerR family transcriptional regulator [Amycolatopsis suaedae]RZQ62904.1 MerR family transcriptional regulator [Amycolatopsis suaedae]